MCVRVDFENEEVLRCPRRSVLEKGDADRNGSSAALMSRCERLEEPTWCSELEKGKVEVQGLAQRASGGRKVVKRKFFPFSSGARKVGARNFEGKGAQSAGPITCWKTRRGTRGRRDAMIIIVVRVQEVN